MFCCTLQYAVLVLSENESVDKLRNPATAAARNVFLERPAKFRRTVSVYAAGHVGRHFLAIHRIHGCFLTAPPRPSTREGCAISLRNGDAQRFCRLFRPQLFDVPQHKHVFTGPGENLYAVPIPAAAGLLHLAYRVTDRHDVVA